MTVAKIFSIIWIFLIAFVAVVMAVNNAQNDAPRTLVIAATLFVLIVGFGPALFLMALVKIFFPHKKKSVADIPFVEVGVFDMTQDEINNLRAKLKVYESRRRQQAQH